MLIMVITFGQYHLLGKWRKSNTLTKLAKPLVIAWCKEMAHVNLPDKYTKGSIFGKVVRIVGEPACSLIGKLVKKQDYSMLYNKKN